MRMTKENLEIANMLRGQLQQHTETVSDAQGVAMLLLWTFLMDHAECQQMDVEELARDQMEAFIEYAKDNVSLAPSPQAH